MSIIVLSYILSASLFVGMLVLLEVGRRIGRHRLATDPEGAKAGTGTIEAALFALLGLLIALTFSGAAVRFDARRQLIAEEANAIGTAYLRLDLLNEDFQPALRVLFREYVDARLAAYGALPDMQTARRELARATVLQHTIWNDAVSACRRTVVQQPATMLLLPALNQMIDITSVRTMAAMTHPPGIIYVLLFGLGLLCSLLAGYGMAAGKRRSWLHMLEFAFVLAITLYVILDLEFPRLGFIRIDAADCMLVEVRQSMDPPQLSIR